MGLGWGNFFGGLGEVIGKITTFIPGRIEGLKNERQRLLKERERLLKEPADAKSAARMDRLTARLLDVNGLLANKSQD